MPSIFSIITSKLFSNSSVAGLAVDTTIIPQYEPPEDLTAAEMGLLIDHRAGRLEFLATIYQLKTEKVITLSRDEKDSVTMKLLQYPKNELSSYEDLLLRFFFYEKSEVVLDHFFNSQEFAFVQGYFQYQVMQSLQRKGYLFIEEGYESQPYATFLNKALEDPIGYALRYIKDGVSKNLTEKARQSMPQLEGFKQYIETAELDKIKFHAKGSLEEYIELLTPYAVAFNQIERWGLINIPLFVKAGPGQIKNTADNQQDYSQEAFMNELVTFMKEIDSRTVVYS